METQKIQFCSLAFKSEALAEIRSFVVRGKSKFTVSFGPFAPKWSCWKVYLRTVIKALEPEWVIGIGNWAEKRATEALGGATGVPGLKFGRILHPSPASPAANRGWAEAATRQLRDMGIWRD